MAEPNLIVFLLNIAGAAALLIWAVRLVRTGVERGFSTRLRQWIKVSSKSRLIAASSGIAAAICLQSSTAVALFISNFAAQSGLSATVGLALLLGADFGSALLTQLLLVRQPFLVPLCLLIGIGLFLRHKNGKLHQVGRALIGLGLIFVSLDMIREATQPLMASPGTQVVMEYLSGDFLTAFVIGAGFAWLVHSSVAAVLLFVTLAAQSVLPVVPATAMVLGANLGGVFIAYVLTLSAPIASRRIILSNLLLRGGAAILIALVLARQSDAIAYFGASAGQQVVNIHLAFNLGLLVLMLPFVTPIMKLMEQFTPEPRKQKSELETATALDPAVIDRPSRALDCAARELLTIGQMIEKMLLASAPLYDQWDSDKADAILAKDKLIKKMHLDLKLYLARIGQKGLDEELGHRSLELASISVNLDAASDAIARIMVTLAKRLDAESVRFSEKGRKEINDFQARVHENVKLALNVMLNQNPSEARELVAAKEKVRKVEQKLQRQHLGRLRKGLVESIETSNIHQETLRALKLINTSFSMIGHPILKKSGDLLESRLA